MKFKFLAFFCAFMSTKVDTKVLIITFNYNNPEFIRVQKETFKYFLQDDYEFVVYSDAPTESGHQKIVRACQRCGVECVRIPQKIHEHPYYLPLNMPEIYRDHTTPSNVRHVHCVQYSLDTRGFNHDGIVVLIDSDMFPVRPLSITEYMKDCDIAAYFKGSDNGRGSTISYCCPALTFLNMETLPDKKTLNFNCGLVNGCVGDSGGFTHYYLTDHPNLRLKSIESIYGGQLFCSDRFYPGNNQHNVNVPNDQKIAFWTTHGFSEKEINFLLKNPDSIQYFTEGQNCWFFHYRGASNYENLPMSYHINKKKLINKYLQDILMTEKHLLKYPKQKHHHRSSDNNMEN